MLQNYVLSSLPLEDISENVGGGVAKRFVQLRSISSPLGYSRPKMVEFNCAVELHFVLLSLRRYFRKMLGEAAKR